MYIDNCNQSIEIQNRWTTFLDSIQEFHLGYERVYCYIYEHPIVKSYWIKQEDAEEANRLFYESP